MRPQYVVLWGSTDESVKILGKCVSVFFSGKREFVSLIRCPQWPVTLETVKKPCHSSAVILLGKPDRMTFLSGPVPGVER